MSTVGVICYVLLSGLSPFMGETDVDTFTNITRADYDFDDDAFDAVSEEARDFIASLLLHRKEDRLSAKQCLASKWLSQHYDVMGSTKLCTDKLKKFIIRRKWQVRRRTCELIAIRVFREGLRKFLLEASDDNVCPLSMLSCSFFVVFCLLTPDFAFGDI